MKRRTPWFPPSVEPVRVGWYQVEWLYGEHTELWFNYWDGKHWHWGWRSMEDVRRDPEPGDRVYDFDGVSFLRWRGLTCKGGKE